MKSRKLNIWHNSDLETDILSTPGELVDDTNFPIAYSMAQALEQTFLEKFSDYPVFGLSACQIAESKEEVLKLFFLHQNGEKMVYANPRIIESSETKFVSRMYCCSTEGGKRVLLFSPVYIILEFLDIFSKQIVRRVFYHPSCASIIHELSHLDGKSIEADMIHGTKVCTGDILKNLDENDRTKMLLGDHYLNQHYSNGGKILVTSSEGKNIFLLQDGTKILLT